MKKDNESYSDYYERLKKDGVKPALIFLNNNEKVEEKYNIPTRVISKFEDIVDYIKENAQEGDFVLVAGSQSINKVAADLVEALKNM